MSDSVGDVLWSSGDRPPQGSVVGLLEEMLAAARRGDIQGVAVAVDRGNGAIGTAFSIGDPPHGWNALVSATVELADRVRREGGSARG